jgi:hypothetical protein
LALSPAAHVGQFETPLLLEVIVYVPTGSAARTIDRGSGVCSCAEADETQLLVDYEGNRYGASNLATFGDRVHIAAGRHRERYPTVARGMYPVVELEPVGVFDEEFAGRHFRYAPSVPGPGHAAHHTADRV